jgi:nitrile hydratase accessory protein
MTVATKIPDIQGDAAIPRDDAGPVFAAPWEAHAFALVVRLFEQGHYSWSEWVQYLSAEIAAAKNAPDPSQPRAYYEQWLAAAEKLIVAKGIATARQLADRKSELAAPTLLSAHAAHNHDHRD